MRTMASLSPIVTVQSKQVLTSGSRQAPTDLAILWKKAFVLYNDNVGEGPKLNINGLGLVTSLEDVKKSVDSSSKSFKHWRHDGDKLDKVRSFIGENLGHVQMIGDQVISSATAAFPPSGAIWTVATYAIKACQTQSADYDQLLTLIGETGNFLKALQIIEENIPNVVQYSDCVIDALSALMVVFAIQTRFMVDGRGLQFWHSLKRGSDPELTKAYGNVTNAIDRLSRANTMMAVRNTEELKRLLARYGAKVDSFYEEMVNQLQQQSEQTNQTINAGFQQQGVSLSNIQQSIKDLRIRLEQQSTKVEATQGTAKDIPARNSAAINKARQYFGAAANPAAKFKDIQQSFVEGTDTWLSEDKEYVSWLNGESQTVWLTGETGVGKSHLAYSAIRTLQDKAKTQPRTSVAYFFFQQGNEPFRSSKNALCSAGLQIATQDQKIRETLASEVGKESCELSSVDEVWAAFFCVYFKAESKAQLYLVLDGLDEGDQDDVALLLNCFQMISREKLRIHVLFTGRHSQIIDEFIKELKPTIVEATVKKSQKGLKKLVEKRFESLPRLSKFSRFAKSKISKALLDKDYSPLYVDIFLHYLDSKGFERPCLRAIEPGMMPKDLAALNDEILVRCNDKRTAEETAALKLIFSWMAFAERPLTLEEVYWLMLLKFGTIVLDFEEEAAGKCASILEISSIVFEESKEELKVKGKVVDVEGDLQGPPGFQPDSALFIKFQERSLRDHIGGAKTEETGLRTPRFTAQVDMFLTCADALCGGDELHAAKQQSALAALQKYAITYWSLHFQELAEAETVAKVEDGFSVSEDQLVLVVEALYRITTNQKDVTDLFFKYPNFVYDQFDSDISDVMASWAGRALQCTQRKLSTEAVQWAKKTVAEPKLVLQPLARGHVLHWMSQVGDTSIMISFQIAMKAYKTKYVGEDIKDIDDIAADKAAYLKEVLALSEAFDIEKGPSAYWAIGVVLTFNEQFEDATVPLNKSLELCKTDQDRFASLCKLAANSAQSDFDHTEEGDKSYEYLVDALALPRHMATEEDKKLVQWALMLLASWERDYDMEAKAVELDEEALTVWSGDDSGIFNDLILSLDSLGEHEKILQSVEKWGPLRLAISDENWDAVNTRYQKAAKLTGKENVMMTTYELLEQELDPLKWASPTRYQLAVACRRTGDIPKAKRLLYLVLDDESCIDPATNMENDSIPYLARRELAEIIFEEFRTMKTASEKELLLREIEELPNRNLGKTDVEPDLILQARMYEKLGPAEKFQNAMEKAFKSCIAALEDDNPWNDQATLRQLCNVLACLPGLEKEASIALSAQFYKLSGDDEEEYADYVGIPCSGTCTDNPKGFSDWNKPVYRCVICADSDWCEECYKKRGIDTWRTYCGPTHKYVKGPMDGWKGIKNGKIMIEGEEIEFTDWLKDLKNDKWTKAWERFWIG